MTQQKGHHDHWPGVHPFVSRGNLAPLFAFAELILLWLFSLKHLFLRDLPIASYSHHWCKTHAIFELSFPRLAYLITIWFLHASFSSLPSFWVPTVYHVLPSHVSISWLVSQLLSLHHCYVWLQYLPSYSLGFGFSLHVATIPKLSSALATQSCDCTLRWSCFLVLCPFACHSTA